MKQFLKTLFAYFIITFVWATLYNEVLFDNTLNEMDVGWRDTPLFHFGFLTMIIQSIAIFRKELVFKKLFLSS